MAPLARASGVVGADSVPSAVSRERVPVVVRGAGARAVDGVPVDHDAVGAGGRVLQGHRLLGVTVGRRPTSVAPRKTYRSRSAPRLAVLPIRAVNEVAPAGTVDQVLLDGALGDGRPLGAHAGQRAAPPVTATGPKVLVRPPAHLGRRAGGHRRQLDHGRLDLDALHPRLELERVVQRRRGPPRLHLDLPDPGIGFW